jgi:hypothetical protein
MNTKAIVPWENLPTEQLANEFSDYYKSFWGCRPRHVDLTDRAELLRQLNRLDQTIAYMKSTPRGRETLREEGWIE